MLPAGQGLLHIKVAAKKAVIPDKPGKSRAQIRDRRKRRAQASIPDLRAARSSGMTTACGDMR